MEGETMEGDDGGGPWRGTTEEETMEGDDGGGLRRGTTEEDHGRRPWKREPWRETTEEGTTEGDHGRGRCVMCSYLTSRFPL